jgi:hypothetical protein
MLFFREVIVGSIGLIPSQEHRQQYVYNMDIFQVYLDLQTIFIDIEVDIGIVDLIILSI